MPTDDQRNAAGAPRDDSNAAAGAPRSAALALPAEISDQVRSFMGQGLAPATRRAYAAAWGAFERWCGQRKQPFLPAAPETVAGFLANTATPAPEGQGLGLSTVEQRIVAIRLAHRLRQQPDPTAHEVVKLTYEGIRRALGERPKNRVVAVRLTDLARALEQLDTTTPRGKLEAAVLLVGHAGAFRRSELRALDLPDATRQAWGYALLLRRSKTDQTGAGVTKAIPRAPPGRGMPCPVAALDAWLELRGRRDPTGPLFKPVMSNGTIWSTRVQASTIAKIVKRAALAANVSGHVAGHSLRVGFITDAVAAGAPVVDIMRQTDHRDYNQVREYIRDIDPLQGNAVTAVYGGKPDATDIDK